MPIVSPAAHRSSRARAGGVLATMLIVLLVIATLGRQGAEAGAGKTITLGASLDDAQKTELLTFFKAKTGKDQIFTISTADTIKAMDGIFPAGSITSAFSSTALTCRNLGDGLDITISNITVVTPDLYAIALVTAGIGDATLVVAAPNEAPAQGMTALAGVFKTWDLAPCDSGNTTKARQRLALEQLADAVAIGQALIGAGVEDGMIRAGNIVLESQKTIVTEKLTKSSDIDAAITAQEQAQGVTVPADLHAKLVDVMSQLAKQKIDWSTFSAGWTIQRDAGNTRVTMTGDGIAIRHARQTATAQAAVKMTQTAKASAANQTAEAKANANATQTAAAEANARATERAIAAMTATAAARPSPSPTPTPSPTPSPSSASGTITGLHGNGIDISPPGGGSQTYALASNAAIVRDGKTASAGQLKIGDSVQMTVDGMTKLVTDLRSEPAPVSLLSRLLPIAAVLGLLALAGAASMWLLARRRRGNDPFVITLQLP